PVIPAFWWVARDSNPIAPEGEPGYSRPMDHPSVLPLLDRAIGFEPAPAGWRPAMLPTTTRPINVFEWPGFQRPHRASGHGDSARIRTWIPGLWRPGCLSVTPRCRTSFRVTRSHRFATKPPRPLTPLPSASGQNKKGLLGAP